MWRNLLLVVLVLGAIGVMGFWPDSPPAPVAASDEARVYPAVPDFSFTPLGQDSPVSIRSLAGKTVLLNFWASWCVPCRVEFPQFVALARRFPETLVILAVSVDSKAADRDKFLEEMGERPHNLVIIPDPDRIIAQDLFQTLRYPETIIIGPDQTLRDKVAGVVEWEGDEMLNRLQLVPDKAITR
jgi:thiol-disulfide isomerase/thioredoxin